MHITNNWNIIYAQTNDYCVIGTTNILETISKMTWYWWTLVEQMDDNNSVILCFAKWDLLNELHKCKQ